VLIRENSVVDQTVANSIGEFQFDCDNWNNLKICLGIADETFIEVPLPNAISGQSTGSAKKATESDSEHREKSE